MVRVLVCLALALVALAPRAHADDANAEAVALLPLDADQRLEIYGQPVASEIARALVAGGIDVVVVGPKMAVPERARLIVDGRIAGGKGDAVVLTIRVRNRVDGVVLATMESRAAGLPNIDKAAADLSARVLPAVRTQLAALRAPATGTPPTERPALPAAIQRRPLLVAISASGAAAERLRPALTDAFGAWAAAHHREPAPTEPAKMTRKLATSTVKTSGHDLGIALEVLGYHVESGTVPLARARVRVRISDAVGIVFDRVIVTDTIVGDKQMSADALVLRAAREVIDIMRPHVQRTVVNWR